MDDQSKALDIDITSDLFLTKDPGILMAIQNMVSKWPAEILSREKIGEFTGGDISSAYMAILDHRGEGVEGRFKIGRKIVYPKRSLALFLLRPAKSIKSKHRAEAGDHE